ncbi:hypothetical protein FOZ63_012618 [Perkinsus olseni]|uniref:Uncharacterized protein n=1 Tax=Perkinsus olseni TaxID=32597 RepID=A0A7J6PT66_PEROL|nr:hypothetical protein FOZ63_012618 [Perkinsus olseni]
MPPAEAKESSAEHVKIEKEKQKEVNSGSLLIATIHDSMPTIFREVVNVILVHSSQRPPINRPKVPYDLQPPYAILGGFPEYKTDYMQLGNYPEDEMAFMPCWKQGPPTGRLRQYLMLLMFEELTIDEELFYFILQHLWISVILFKLLSCSFVLRVVTSGGIRLLGVVASTADGKGTHGEPIAPVKVVCAADHSSTIWDVD